MTQSPKDLQYKHEDLSSKNPDGQHTSVIPVPGGRNIRTPRAHWPVSLAEQKSSRIKMERD